MSKPSPAAQMPAEQSSAAGPSALPDEPPSSVTELSLYDAGVTALSELHDLPSMTSLRSLNLHSNRVARISHLEPLVRLRSLNLSSNQIEVMEGLHALRQLEVLDLSCNRIRMIDGLAALGQLRRRHTHSSPLSAPVAVEAAQPQCDVVLSQVREECPCLRARVPVREARRQHRQDALGDVGELLAHAAQRFPPFTRLSSTKRDPLQEHRSATKR